MMKYIILEEENAIKMMGVVSGVNMLLPTRILSGAYIGKFACAEDSDINFSELFSPFGELLKMELPESAFLKDPVNRNISGYGIEIPIQYQWIFDQDKFILNEFEIPLATKDGKKYVDVSYFNWPEFRFELDLKDDKGQFIFAALKRSLMPLWDYVADQVTKNNLVAL